MRLAIAILLVTGSVLALVPSSSASPCDTSTPDVGCSATTGPCTTSAGANVITTTAAGAESRCRVGFMTCHTEAGLGQTLDPDYEHWCAF